MDIESDAEEENEEEISMEYFEPEDVKYSPPPSPEPLHGSQLQEDPIIEISSDSEEEEAGPSQGIGRLPGPTPRLTGLNERQQTALLELGMDFLEDSPASGLHNSSSSSAATQLCRKIPSNIAPRVVKRKAPPDPGILEKVPRLVSSSSSSHFEKGWKVETVDDQHYIPCPECKTRVRIVDASSLTDHLERFHPEQNWEELRNRWHCQLCPRSSVVHNFQARAVFDHMRMVHSINLKGPMARPAWMPTSSTAIALICPECQMIVPTTSMKAHLTNVNHTHKDLQNFKYDKKYNCKLCSLMKRGDTLVHVDNLVDHMKNAHGKLLTPRPPSVPGIVIRTAKRKLKKGEKQNNAKPDDPKVWTFLSDKMVKCKECVADTKVRIQNLQKHWTKCHMGANINDGLCGLCNQRVSIPDILAHQFCIAPYNTLPTDVPKPSQTLTMNSVTPTQIKQIIHECVVGMVTPKDLAKKWNCNASKIRTWVKKAGLTPPTGLQFKKSMDSLADSLAGAFGQSSQQRSGYHPIIGTVSPDVSDRTTPPSSSSSLSASLSRASGSGHLSKGTPGNVIESRQIENHTVSSRTEPLVGVGLEKELPGREPGGQPGGHPGRQPGGQPGRHPGGEPASAEKESSNNERRRSSAEEGEILSEEDTPSHPSSSASRPFATSPTNEISAEQRAKLVKEALEEKLTLGDLAKKYNRSADSIRGWVREAAGQQLPKSFNRFSLL